MDLIQSVTHLLSRCSWGLHCSKLTYCTFHCEKKPLCKPICSFFDVKTLVYVPLSAAGGGRETAKEIKNGCVAFLWWSYRVGTGPYGNADHMEAEETCSSRCVHDYGYRCRRLVRLTLGKGEIIWRVIQWYRESGYRGERLWRTRVDCLIIWNYIKAKRKHDLSHRGGVLALSDSDSNLLLSLCKCNLHC